MAQLTLMFIRHGEKPGETWPGSGLTSDGTSDPLSLVIRGWQRAGSWAALFGGGLGGSQFPRPVTVYAANPAMPAGDDVSQRPFETVSPLAARLGGKPVPVTTYGVGQEPALVAELTGLTGVILVCWEHKAIAKHILPALFDGQMPADVPRKWDGTRFDPVLRLDRTGAHAPWSFQQLLPCLLAGDSDKGMP